MTQFSGAESGDSRAPANPPPYPYPPGSYPPPPYPDFPTRPPGQSTGYAVASLVIGILAVVTAPVLIGLVLGVMAVVMGISARRRVKRGEAAHGGLAIAGIAFGVLAIVIGLAVGAIFAFGFATDQFNEDYQHCLGEHNGMAQYCEQYR
jgi:Domain of unknown function (DUF4190)